jgi:hypothetical protein
MSTPDSRLTGPSALALFEESVHLLRRTPAATFVVYFAGAVPWVAGVLYFWARATWFAPGVGERALAALVLVGLFAGLKVAQAEFCARLLADRLGTTPPPPSAARLRSLAATQLRLQVWGWFALPLAAVLAAPFGWLFAFYQNASVLGLAAPGRPPVRREAWAQAEIWPAQNHVGLLLLQAFGLVLWINFAASIYTVPWLANRLLGIENLFAIQGLALFNTTFLALVTLLSWLALDPLVKAFYTLRVFHGRAGRTGDDLRTALAAARRPSAVTTSPRRASAVALLLLLALGVTAPPPRAHAAHETGPSSELEPAPTPPATPAPALLPTLPPAVTPPALDRAIDGALADGDFQWALRPLPREKSAEPGNAFQRFLHECMDFLLGILRSIGRAIADFVEWLVRLLTPRGRESAFPGKSTGINADLVRLLLYLVTGAVALGLVWIVVQLWRQGRRPRSAAVLTATAVAAAPDLRDESVQAAQLPCDGWLALAHEQIAAGQWRLALRALYLATLARRAAEGLLVLARSKTNLDYERELARRALARRELVEHFRHRRRSFEEVWYGEAAATEPEVRAWLAEFEPPATP